MQFLNSREVKKVQKAFQEQWGATIERDVAFIRKNTRIFIISKDFSKVDTDKIRVDALGLYIADEMNDGFRLSIEGSQLIGPRATKNVVELNEDETRNWFRGEDIIVEHEDAFVIVKHDKDFIGSGKIKKNRLLNFVPKIRRISVI